MEFGINSNSPCGNQKPEIMDVTIILVNFNTIIFLLDALDSVFDKSEGFNFEIIVVDNNSSDNSKNILEARYGNKVIYLSLPQNIGFGNANNEALKIAKGRNIFLLNPDTILVNNAIKKLCDYLDQNEGVAICGGNLYNSDLTPSLSYFKHKHSITLEIDLLTAGLFSRIFIGKNSHFNYSKTPIEVTMISGADLMIKKNVIDKIGLFDPDFFVYFEDNELSVRALKNGYKIINIPDAKIIHLVGKSHIIKENSQRLFFNGRKIYYKKTHNDLYFFLANTIYQLAAITHIIYFNVINLKSEYYHWKLRYRIFKEVNYKESIPGIKNSDK